MAVTLSDFFGRTIRWLASNQYVDLTKVASYPLFTTGTVNNRSPESRTVIAFVTITPNITKVAWDGGLGTFNIDNQVWATNQQLAQYAIIPSAVFPSSSPTTRPGPYANGHVFTFDMSQANANDGIATVAAYGWTV